jgi:hypothetical protein
MAIKGKKKTQTRGSQARRRPSTAPRPAIAPRGAEPWYRTPGGRVAVAVIAVLLIATVGGVIAAVNSNNRAEQESRDRRQQAMDDFTAQVSALRQELSGPVTEMFQVPEAPDDRALKDITKQAEEWTLSVSGAIETQGQLKAPPQVTGLNQLLFQAIRSYDLAADTYILAGETKDAELALKIIRKADSIRNGASSVWAGAIQQLDAARDALGMAASGVGLPNAAPGA